MGGKQSKLKKELEALKAEAAAAAAKHTQAVETLRNEKRMLEFKLQSLQEMTAQAQVEAETATQLALESEEKVKALKWELVRRVSVPTNKGIPTSPTSSLTASTSSLASSSSDLSTSAVPRVPVNWKLKDGVALRRSNTSLLPKTRSRPEREGSEEPLKKPAFGSDVVVQRIPLTKPLVQAISDKSDSVEKKPSNQEEATVVASPKPVVVAPSPTLTSVPTAVASAAAFDMFAPVKRRSSTRDSPVTITAPLATEAKVDDESEQHIEAFKKSTSARDSDSERELSSKSEASSSSGKEDERRAQPSRGVLATAKGRGPQESKSDDVLALSDDEED